MAVFASKTFSLTPCPATISREKKKSIVQESYFYFKTGCRGAVSRGRGTDETLDADRLEDYIAPMMPVNIPMVSERAYTYGNYRIIPPGDLDHTLLGR